MLNAERTGLPTSSIASKNIPPPDEVEAFFYGGHSALTRFANNTIHQNVAEENVAVSVRTVFGGRTARATTNKFDDESLRRVVKASEKLARVQHPDADLLPMPEAGEVAPRIVNRYFEETAAITPERRAEGLGKIVGIAQKNRLTTAGIFSTSESVEGIFNSRGLRTMAYADFVGNFDHDAGGGFIGMAEGELAGCGASSMPAAWRRLRRRRRGVGWSAGNSGGEVHGDSRAGGGARHGWVHVL